MEREKLKDVASFGLEWQLKARLNDWLNGSGNWPPKGTNQYYILIPTTFSFLTNLLKIIHGY